MPHDDETTYKLQIPDGPLGKEEAWAETQTRINFLQYELTLTRKHLMMVNEMANDLTHQMKHVRAFMDVLRDKLSDL